MKYEQIVPPTLLKHHRIIDNWFPLRYSLDLYAGCVAGCRYCPVNLRKEKTITTYYGLVGKLERELAMLDVARVSGTHGQQRTDWKPLIGLGAGLHDPLMPLSETESPPLFPEVLDLLGQTQCRALILTKYPNILQKFLTTAPGERILKRAFAAYPTHEPIVLSAFTTLDNEEEARHIEVGVPTVAERLTALHQLHSLGLPTGALILSLAPWEQEQELSRLTELLNQLYAVGVNFVILNFLFPDSMNKVYQRLYHQHKQCASLARFGEGSVRIEEALRRHAATTSGQPATAPVSLFHKEKLQVEQAFRQTMKTLGLPFMLPPPLYRNHLSPKDASAATLIQMYYLLRDMGKRRDFFKMASYHLSQLTEDDFAAALTNRTLIDLPGIGNYSETMILKMALKGNYEDFDKTFLAWYQF